MSKLEGTNYTVKQLDPMNLSYSEFEPVAEMFMDAFIGDAFIEYRVGPVFTHDQTTEKSSRKYQLCKQSRQRAFYVSQHQPHRIASILYDNDRAIGFVSWTLPIHMFQATRNRMGVWGSNQLMVRIWEIRFKLLKWKYDFLEWLDYRGYSDHPISNDRARLFTQTQQDADESRFAGATNDRLSNLSYDELKTAQYPSNRITRLDGMVISPDYQRQGLGGKLLCHTLANVPNEKTEFKYEGRTAIGPQVLGLSASPNGVGMYEKCGFRLKTVFIFDKDGQHLKVHHMEMVRE